MWSKIWDWMKGVDKDRERAREYFSSQWDRFFRDQSRRRLADEIARLKRNKKRHSHLQAELDRLNAD